MDSSLAGKVSLENNFGGNGLENPSASEKQYTSHGKLQVNDKISETSDSPPDDDGNSGSTEMSSKCLQKCATFPVSTISDGNNPESQLEEGSEVFTCSLSRPTVKKPISAMKGTRKKEGLPQINLSVSWAPDVYDPAPSSVSHFPKKRNSRSQKKHGKGKQKGRSIIESRVKDLDLDLASVQTLAQILLRFKTINRLWSCLISMILVLVALEWIGIVGVNFLDKQVHLCIVFTEVE